MFDIIVGLTGLMVVLVLGFIAMVAWFLKNYMVPLVRKDLERTTYSEEQGRKLKQALISTYNMYPGSKKALMHLKNEMKKEDF